MTGGGAVAAAGGGASPWPPAGVVASRYLWNSKVIGHTENEEKDRFRMEKNEGILLMAFWGIAFKIN